jgi:hypothetical protein
LPVACRLSPVVPAPHCPGDALNNGQDLLVLGPAETRALWLEIAAS